MASAKSRRDAGQSGADGSFAAGGDDDKASLAASGIIPRRLLLLAASQGHQLAAGVLKNLDSSKAARGSSTAARLTPVPLTPHEKPRNRLSTLEHPNVTDHDTDEIA